jgi:hypothetical protein
LKCLGKNLTQVNVADCRLTHRAPRATRAHCALRQSDHEGSLIKIVIFATEPRKAAAIDLRCGTRDAIGPMYGLAVRRNVWSGRALQVDFAELAVSGLASMYPACDWSVFCSGPSWISARLRSH